MKEILEIFDLKGKKIGESERNLFYEGTQKQFDKTGKVSKQTKTVRILLMNSVGRIYLQKRSKIKKDNSGLYDKTVGGHVSKGVSFDVATVKECAEELGFPASALSTKDFKNSIHSIDVSIVGVLRCVDVLNNFQSVRILKNGKKFVQPYITAIYIGYYDGAIRFADGESSGIEAFSLNELEEEIKTRPEKFTEDLKFMVKRYKKYLIPVSDL